MSAVSINGNVPSGSTKRTASPLNLLVRWVRILPSATNLAALMEASTSTGVFTTQPKRYGIATKIISFPSCVFQEAKRGLEYRPTSKASIRSIGRKRSRETKGGGHGIVM
jgi:hypothetical protein